MCLKNGSVEPARPCCFPVLRPGFRTPGLLLSTADHRNVSQTFILIAFRATFTTYHCRRGKRGSKMRLTNGSVAAARLFPCRSSLDARPRCDCFYSGFKRNVLTSGVEEMCLKNGSVKPARPCCFPVLSPGFRTQGLLLSTANHRNVSQTFVLIAFCATFTTYHCRRGKRGSKMRLTNGSVAAARLCCSPAGAVWMLGHGVFL